MQKLILFTSSKSSLSKLLSIVHIQQYNYYIVVMIEGIGKNEHKEMKEKHAAYDNCHDSFSF